MRWKEIFPIPHSFPLSPYNKSMLRLQTLMGREAAPYIPQLAHLRMTVFRDFPYLYEGDLEYEKHYLQAFTASSKSFMAIVFDDDKVIGASTAMPLLDEHEEFRKPFVDYNLEDIFYFGESLLMPNYRGQGWGVKFFEARENHARQKGYKIAAFCAVERSKDHPAKPKDYKPLHTFWHKRGFERQADLMTYYDWKDIGDTEQTAKPMVFWLKHLETV
jgi:GNAT superfamily N-acetyltransferase